MGKDLFYDHLSFHHSFTNQNGDLMILYMNGHVGS